MRILAVNWRDRQDPMGGGAEVHLHELLRRLVQWGHEVTWLACSWPGAPAEEVRDDGIRYRRAGHWAVAPIEMGRIPASLKVPQAAFRSSHVAGISTPLSANGFAAAASAFLASSR